MNMRKLGPLFVALSAGSVLPAAHAATLRPYCQVAGGIVHLADLFDDLGATPDRALGRAPEAGERITVEAPQLAAIAHDFGVAWRPQSGAERAVVERSSQSLGQAEMGAILRQALEEAGAPPRADIAMPAFEPILLPTGARPEIQISQLSYDAASSRFTALVSVSVPDVPPAERRISGQAIPMVDAVVPTHMLSIGTIVSAQDVQPARVREGLLHGRTQITPEAAIGMAARHTIAAGQPLTTADLMRQTLVVRGATVHMTLASGGIALSAQGIAVDQGSLGDRIRVQNPASRAIVEADVTGAGEVTIEPRAAAISLAAAQ